MKTLTVSLVDLEGIPHGTTLSHTSVSVEAAYTGPVVLTDGKIVPQVIKAKPLPSSGSVSFEVHASDSPLVRSDHRGFAVRVTVKGVTTRGPRTGWEYTRTVKVLEAGGAAVALGSLPAAEGLPAQWTTVADMEAALAAQTKSAADAQALAAQAATDAAAAAERAEAARVSSDAAMALLAAGQPTERMTSNLLALSAQQGAKTFTAPPGFAFPIAVTPTRDEVGRYTVPDVDVESLHQRREGPTYYVDPVSGSNANTGLSWAQAFKTPAYASAKNSANAAEIICRGGIYLRSDLPGSRTSSLVLRAAPGERPVFACCDVLPDTAWTLSAGTTWQATKASVAGVLDTLVQDGDGDPTQLRKAATLAACQATPGTWFAASGVLYVNVADGRKPDPRVLISMAVSTWSIDPAYVTTASSHYMDGIEWWGGTGLNMTAPADGSRVLGRRARVKFASANGLSVWGQHLAVFEECAASKNHLDGFSYHDNQGRTTAALEISCVGIGNGWDTTGSQNGSTSHETCTVIRVGGSYRANAGANVADVNSAKSWNVGVQAAQSLDYGQDFYGQSMWLDACRSGSRIAIAGDKSVSSSPAVRHRATILAGELDSAAQAW